MKGAQHAAAVQRGAATKRKGEDRSAKKRLVWHRLQTGKGRVRKHILLL